MHSPLPRANCLCLSPIHSPTRSSAQRPAQLKHETLSRAFAQSAGCWCWPMLHSTDDQKSTTRWHAHQHQLAPAPNGPHLFSDFAVKSTLPVHTLSSFTTPATWSSVQTVTHSQTLSIWHSHLHQDPSKCVHFCDRSRRRRFHLFSITLDRTCLLCTVRHYLNTFSSSRGLLFTFDS